jgi:hypothetical protein
MFKFIFVIREELPMIGACHLVRNIVVDPDTTNALCTMEKGLTIKPVGDMRTETQRIAFG